MKVNAPAADLVEPAEVLDDRDARAEQRGVDRTLPLRVLSMFTESMPTTAAPASTSRSAVATARYGWSGIAVALRAPVGVPPGAEQHRSARQRPAPSSSSAPASASAVASITTPGTATTRARSSPARSWPSAKRWNGRVEVGAGVGHHVDPPDLELEPGRVPLPRGLPAQVVADHRPGQPRVGDGPVGDRVAQVDDLGHRSLSRPPIRWRRAGFGGRLTACRR